MSKIAMLGILSALSLFPQEPPAPALASLKWLAGDWGATSQTFAAEEHWLPPAAGMMLGMSRTIVRDRTVSFEFLRIEQRPDGIYYVAQPGGRPPVAFKLTASTATSAIFENPQHDHPKIITYRLESPEILIAGIEGDEGGKHKKQEFQFRRISK